VVYWDSGGFAIVVLVSPPNLGFVVVVDFLVAVFGAVDLPMASGGVQLLSLVT